MLQISEMKLRADDQGRLDYPIRIMDGDNPVALMVSEGHRATPEALQMALRMTQAFNAYSGVHLIPQQTIKTYLESRVDTAPEGQKEAFQEVLTVLCGQPR